MVGDDFLAVVVEEGEGGGRTVAMRRFAEADLMAGDVTVRIGWSAVNYKDGLAVTGRMPVVRRWPMVPGIDGAGTVIASADPRYRPGDAVLITGWGIGETHLGAWSERLRVPGDWLTPMPAGLSEVEAMALGTAGLTALLAVEAIERAGLTPADGAAVVTGAAGGVGSLTVMLLARAGWCVTAVTGRAGEASRLAALGAGEVVGRDVFAGPPRPLNGERWIAAVDVVGGNVLGPLLSMIGRGGVVAACGNAGGMAFAASLAPFILRAVSLVGIDSVRVPPPRRQALWTRLAADVDREKLRAMTRVLPFEAAIDEARRIVDGAIAGRVVLRLASR